MIYDYVGYDTSLIEFLLDHPMVCFHLNPNCPHLPSRVYLGVIWSLKGDHCSSIDAAAMFHVVYLWKNLWFNVLFSVVGFMDYYAQSYLEYVMNPDEIVSSNWDFEEELRLTKLMTEEFNNYRTNFSGDIVFDINDDSKI